MKKKLCHSTNHNHTQAPPPGLSYYEIRLKGLIDPDWDWLENMVVIYLEPGETLIRGLIVDQAALHGMLSRIRDLNLTLLSVNRLAPENNGKEE